MSEEGQMSGRCAKIYKNNGFESRCVFSLEHAGACAFPTRKFKEKNPEDFEYFLKTEDYPFKRRMHIMNLSSGILAKV